MDKKINRRKFLKILASVAVTVAANPVSAFGKDRDRKTEAKTKENISSNKNIFQIQTNYSIENLTELSKEEMSNFKAVVLPLNQNKDAIEALELITKPGISDENKALLLANSIFANIVDKEKEIKIDVDDKKSQKLAIIPVRLLGRDMKLKVVIEKDNKPLLPNEIVRESLLRNFYNRFFIIKDIIKKDSDKITKAFNIKLNPNLKDEEFVAKKDNLPEKMVKVKNPAKDVNATLTKLGKFSSGRKEATNIASNKSHRKRIKNTKSM